MATIARVSPTTSAANLHHAMRRRLQEFDPEKSLQSEEEELYQADDDDDDSESHEYQPVRGSIRVLRALFCRKNNSNVKGARISRQMWRKGVTLFLFFALAIFGALEMSLVGGGNGERTSLLHLMASKNEVLSLKEEEEVNLTSWRMTIRRKSQRLVH